MVKVKWIDYKFGDDLDLIIQDGDFAIADSEEQHKFIIILTQQGDWRQSPVVGVNAFEELLNDAPLTDLQHRIQNQLELDGYRVDKILIKGIDNIIVYAKKLK